MPTVFPKTSKLIISFLLLFICVTGNSQEQTATVKEYQQTFATYPYSDPSPIPLLTSVYPYFRYDGFTNKSVQKDWKVVELENDYIKVLILPEIGGKIWTAIEKSTNQPFIYYNHAVKFRDIGMRGPYTSGGLELNFGIIGHTPNSATPVDYVIQNNDDGSVSCIVGVLDLLTRSNWRVEVRLPKDKAYFITRTFWYNSTPISQPYYHWLNGGYKAGGNLEFIYPGTSYIGHGGDYHEWPINKNNGKNISFYESNNFGGYKSYHVFGKYTNFFGGYWHDDDFGMVRCGNHDDKAGKKIWIWGLSRQGMIWEDFLTDTDGQYVEMQSGRLFAQNSGNAVRTPFKHINFPPYGTDIWTEYFYPVLRTKGFVEANEYGALNVKNEKGLLKIYFSPVQKINDLLEVTEGQKVIYSKNLQLSPLAVFADSIEFSGNSQKLKVTLGENKLIYNSDPQANVLSRPTHAPDDFNWDSAYGLYILGREAMDQKMYNIAEEKLEASLMADHNYLPALIKMAELKYRNMLYSQALDYAKRALGIDTQDGAVNYYYGLVNATLGNMVDAKDGFDIATMSSEYRSAAYTELSRIYLKEKQFEKAYNYASRAIDYNRYNIEALQLQAVVCRIQNKLEKEADILNTIIAYDPLNHFSRFEKYLLNPNETLKSQFTSLIRNELPQETYMELAIWYYNSGGRVEAEKVLLLSPPTAETAYWLSFLRNMKVNCKEINPAFSFPFRLESAFVIEQLLSKQDDWLLKFHLALIYRDRNRIEESINLLTSCGDDPDFAPFYAIRAEIMKGKYESGIEKDLNKALSLDNQWRYISLLVRFYNSNGQYDKALLLAETYSRAHADDFVMGGLHAQTLLLNRKYKEADAVLEKINILPNEGATGGHKMYREAKLMQAALLMQKNNYKGALKFINQAVLWPENLGVGQPYIEDIDMRLENWMKYICFQNLKRTKEAENMLNDIIKFTPRNNWMGYESNEVDITSRNFIPANALISARAFEKLNMRYDAIEWLDKQIHDFPDSKLLLWSKATFENDKSFVITENEKDENVRIIEMLMPQSK